MPPPPVEVSYGEMGKAQEGEAHPQLWRAVDICAHRVGIIFRMDYYDRLSRLLVEEGFFPARDRNIKTYPRLLELLRDCPHDMMSLMCHIGRATRLLVTRRDVEHVTDTSHESSHNASPSHHDDEGGFNAFGSTTPSNHV